MSKFLGPTVMYGPKGESEIFTDSSLVPEGWQDDPAKFTADGELVKPPETGDDDKTTAAVALPMARADIVAALKAGKVEFKGNAKTGDLYALLLSALLAHAKEAEIEVPEGATAPDILKLLEVQPSA